MSKNKLIIAGVIIVVLLAAYFTVSNMMMGGSTGSFGINEKSNRADYLNPNVAMTQPEQSAGMGAIDEMSAPREMSQKTVSPEAGFEGNTADKKVIKNGSLVLNVGSANWSAGEISKIAKENGGDVFSSNFYKNSKTNLTSGTIILKVPIANFEKTFESVKKIAAVVARESTSGEDITEQYMDLETRIKNKKAEEESYNKILNQATKISDILEITQYISNVRMEIESMEGQLKYLGNLADMATINIQLSEDAAVAVTDSWRPIQVAKDALNSLIQKAQGFINFMIVLVILVIPVAILYLLLVYVLWRIGKAVYLKIKNRNVQS